MSKHYEATGRYYVAPYTLPIFYTGTVYWPIIDPRGERFATVVGDGIEPGTVHAEQEAASRKTADKLIEVLNRTLP